MIRRDKSRRAGRPHHPQWVTNSLQGGQWLVTLLNIVVLTLSLAIQGCRAVVHFDIILGPNFTESETGYQGPNLICNPQCIAAQKEALMILFQATYGEAWISKGGWESSSLTSHCGFYGELWHDWT